MKNDIYKCDICSRDNFKSKAGLARHRKQCEIKHRCDSLSDAYTKKDKVNPIPNIDLKIRKLEDARASSLDAEHKHNIEVEIKRLKELL